MLGLSVIAIIMAGASSSSQTSGNLACGLSAEKEACSSTTKAPAPQQRKRRLPQQQERQDGQVNELKGQVRRLEEKVKNLEEQLEQRRAYTQEYALQLNLEEQEALKNALEQAETWRQAEAKAHAEAQKCENTVRKRLGHVPRQRRILQQAPPPPQSQVARSSQELQLMAPSQYLQQRQMPAILAREGDSHGASATTGSSRQGSVSSSGGEESHLGLAGENPETEIVNHVKSVSCKANSGTYEHNIIATLHLRAGLKVKRIDLYINIRNKNTRKIIEESHHEKVPYNYRWHNKFRMRIPALDPVPKSGKKVREIKLKFFFNSLGEEEDSISSGWLCREKNSNRFLASDGDSHGAPAATGSSRQRSVSDSSGEESSLGLTEESPETRIVNCIKSVTCRANTKTSEHHIIATLHLRSRLRVKRIDLCIKIRNKDTNKATAESRHESIPYECNIQDKYKIAIPTLDPVPRRGIEAREVREFKLKFFFNDPGEEENSISTLWLHRNVGGCYSRLVPEKKLADSN